jgi:hypothetical protein
VLPLGLENSGLFDDKMPEKVAKITMKSSLNVSNTTTDKEFYIVVLYSPVYSDQLRN